jgi:hypothetical protein
MPDPDAPGGWSSEEHTTGTSGVAIRVGMHSVETDLDPVAADLGHETSEARVAYHPKRTSSGRLLSVDGRPRTGARSRPETGHAPIPEGRPLPTEELERVATGSDLGSERPRTGQLSRGSSSQRGSADDLSALFSSLGPACEALSRPRTGEREEKLLSKVESPEMRASEVARRRAETSTTAARKSLAVLADSVQARLRTEIAEVGARLLEQREHNASLERTLVEAYGRSGTAATRPSVTQRESPLRHVVGSAPGFKPPAVSLTTGRVSPDRVAQLAREVWPSSRSRPADLAFPAALNALTFHGAPQEAEQRVAAAAAAAALPPRLADAQSGHELGRDAPSSLPRLRRRVEAAISACEDRLSQLAPLVGASPGRRLDRRCRDTTVPVAPVLCSAGEREPAQHPATARLMAHWIALQRRRGDASGAAHEGLALQSAAADSGAPSLRPHEAAGAQGSPGDAAPGSQYAWKMGQGPDIASAVHENDREGEWGGCEQFLGQSAATGDEGCTADALRTPPRGSVADGADEPEAGPSDEGATAGGWDAPPPPTPSY